MAHRVRVADGRAEPLVLVGSFKITGTWGLRSGYTPEGSPLLLPDRGTNDIYALDVGFLQRLKAR
jgi:hypothetical protein